MRYLIIIFLLLVTWACEEEIPQEARDELIAQEVQKRVDALVESKYERCMEELLENANTLVDSILIARAKAEKDTIKKPMKPTKPLPPEPLVLEDSSAIKPLLQRQDTLK